MDPQSSGAELAVVGPVAGLEVDWTGAAGVHDVGGMSLDCRAWVSAPPGFNGVTIQHAGRRVVRLFSVRQVFRLVSEHAGGDAASKAKLDKAEKDLVRGIIAKLTAAEQSGAPLPELIYHDVDKLNSKRPQGERYFIDDVGALQMAFGKHGTAGAQQAAAAHIAGGQVQREPEDGTMRAVKAAGLALSSGSLTVKQAAVHAATLWSYLPGNVKDALCELEAARRRVELPKALSSYTPESAAKKVKPLMEDIQWLGRYDHRELPFVVAKLFSNYPEVLVAACLHEESWFVRRSITQRLAAESLGSRQLFAGEVSRYSTRNNYVNLRVIGNEMERQMGIHPLCLPFERARAAAALALPKRPPSGRVTVAANHHSIGLNWPAGLVLDYVFQWQSMQEALKTDIMTLGVMLFVDAARITNIIKLTTSLVGFMNLDLPSDSVTYLYPLNMYSAGDDYANALEHLENTTFAQMRQMVDEGVTLQGRGDSTALCVFLALSTFTRCACRTHAVICFASL